MGRILVIYGTTHGQTGRIAQAMAETLRRDALTVDVMDARDARDASPAGYDGVIVAASIHAGGYQRRVKQWLRRHHSALTGRRGLFVSVCLGVLEKRLEAQRELGRIMRRFLDSCGWEPDMQRHIAGALPYTRYGWLTRRIMRRIVAQAGGDTDTSRDYEYTDWDEVTRLARRFGASVQLADPDRAALMAAPEGAPR